MKKILLGLFLLGVQTSLMAQTTEYFKVTNVYVTSAANYHFRVYGMSPLNYCNNNGWAFINEADSGSKGMMSSLLAAYMAKKNVKLNLIPVANPSGTNTYCKINAITIKD